MILNCILVHLPADGPVIGGNVDGGSVGIGAFEAPFWSTAPGAPFCPLGPEGPVKKNY